MRVATSNGGNSPMTMIWHESFDNYSTAELNIGVYTQFNQVSADVRYGTGRSAQITGFGMNAKRTFSAITDPFFHGFAVTLELGQSANCKFYDGATEQFNVTFTPGAGTATVSVYRGATLLGTSSPFYAAYSSWHYIEIGALLSETVGTVTVRVDEVEQLALTGVNNSAAATTNVSVVGWTAGGAVACIDDLYFLTDQGARNNTFLGEVRHQCLFVTADGSVNDWTASAGARYECVDENPSSMSEYIYDSTPGNIQLFAMQDIVDSPDLFPSITVKFSVLKDDTSLREVASKLKSGATTVTGTTFLVSSQVDWVRQVYETDPDTSAAWTEAGINAIEAGVVTVT